MSIENYIARMVLIIRILPYSGGSRGLSARQLRARLASDGIDIHEDTLVRDLKRSCGYLAIDGRQSERGGAWVFWRTRRNISAHLVRVDDYIGDPVDRDVYKGLECDDSGIGSVPDFPSDIHVFRWS